MRAGRLCRCDDIDDGAIHVHNVDLPADANHAEDTLERLLDRGRLDAWSRLLHVQPDECLACPRHGVRQLVIQNTAELCCSFHALQNSPTTPSVAMSSFESSL